VLREKTREILRLRRVAAPTGFGERVLAVGLVPPAELTQQIARAGGEIRGRRVLGEASEQLERSAMTFA